jgi:hypothetical protein
MLLLRGPGVADAKGCRAVAVGAIIAAERSGRKETRRSRRRTEGDSSIEREVIRQREAVTSRPEWLCGVTPSLRVQADQTGETRFRFRSLTVGC